MAYWGQNSSEECAHSLVLKFLGACTQFCLLKPPTYSCLLGKLEKSEMVASGFRFWSFEALQGLWFKERQHNGSLAKCCWFQDSVTEEKSVKTTFMVICWFMEPLIVEILRSSATFWTTIWGKPQKGWNYCSRVPLFGRFWGFAGPPINGRHKIIKNHF